MLTYYPCRAVLALCAGVLAHALHYARAVLALTLNLSCHVVFFSAVFHAAHMTRPIWTSIRRLTVTGLIAVLTAKACSTSIVVAQPDVNQSIREMSK